MDSGALLLLVSAAVNVACGLICAEIAKRKDRGAGFFFIGLFLGVVGIIVTLLVSPGHPPPPPGMRAVACARCNTVQNVDERVPEFQCWQCNTVCLVKA